MTFTLSLSAEKYRSYYEGIASAVVVTADDGRSIKFPASALQKFVTHDGVAGRFEILFDDNNKMVGINRIG